MELGSLKGRFGCGWETVVSGNKIQRRTRCQGMMQVRDLT